MPSDATVLCNCELCLQDGPHGREMSPVMRSRHRKNEKAKAALGLLVEAERAATTKLVTQAMPTILASESRVLPPNQRGQLLVDAHPEPTDVDTHSSHLHATTMAENLAEYDSTLQNISLTIVRETISLSRPETLLFLVDPALADRGHWQRIHEELRLHSSLAICHKHNFLLRPNPENQEFLRSESVLRESLANIDMLTYLVGSRTRDTAAILDSAQKARQVAFDGLSQLMTWKQSIWTQQATTRMVGGPNSDSSKAEAFCDTVETGRFLGKDQRNHGDHQDHPLVLSSVVHVVLSNLVFGMPIRGCETLLEGFRYHTQIAVDFSQGGLPSSLPTCIPKTLAGAFQHVDLNPTLRQYIVCPKCNSLSPGIQPYPPRCRNRPIPGEPGCQAALLMERRINGKAVHSPIKMYTHQDFKMWLARFLCRPGIEMIVRESQRSADATYDGKVADILSSRLIRNFLGADNLPFLRPVEGQYRLLFALSADGFNALTNKVAKQVRTSTGIYLICLNLPLAMRQLPHNMYLVGVVPGPSKPKEGELNHYLDLVVEDFEPFWDPGVIYTSTALAKATRCYAAIVPIVCDALGAREVSGFPTINSTQFCIYCTLPRTDIENLDFKTWSRRTCTEHKRLAEEWRTANLPARLELQKKSHPARYSSLLRLPYFDPVRFTVIDTMHLLYLGLFERHCRSVWGMNVKLEDGDGTKRGSGTIPSPPIQEEMEIGRLILLSGQPEEFHRRNIKKDVLYYLCEENGLRTGGKKRDLISELREFMSRSCDTAEQTREDSSLTNANVASPTEKRRLSIHSIPPVTDQIKERFVAVESRLARNMALQKCHNEPLRIMCYLRDLSFENPKPVKKDMISALLTWRTEQATLHRWVPSMHVSQLDTLAVAQKASSQHETNADTRPVTVRGVRSPPDGSSLAVKAQTSKRTQSVVLGRRVMDEYVVDRRNMTLPSWITAPPARAGHANHGKMSADQWRVFCTVNLPVTLIRLWTVRQSEPRWKDMLLNFLDLVLAVEIASLVITTDALIENYERLMHRYLETLKSLYKDAPIVQNQHIALHLGEIMRAFGPTPGYQAFGTERFNYTLQRVKTNRHDFGEMEMTMTRSVCRASNLVALLEHPHALPQYLRGSASGALKGDERGTRVNDVPAASAEATSVPRYTHPTKQQSKLTNVMLNALSALLNKDGIKYVVHTQPSKRRSEFYIYPDVTFLRLLRIGRVSYRSCQVSLGSSQVLVKMEDSSQKPGQIQAMFRHARDSPEGRIEDEFVAVRFLKTLNDADTKLDPYRAVNKHYNDGPFQDAFGSLWGEGLEEDIAVFRPHDLLCHFARTVMTVASISVPCSHVQALTRLKTQFEVNGWIREAERDLEMQDDHDHGNETGSEIRADNE